MTLPSTIDDIGDGTFEDCGKLTTIKQTDSNGNEIQNPEYTVPEGTENIGENAFKGTPLDKVSVPSGVQSIGDGAFAVVDENGDLAAGKHPGINITIPGNAIGKNDVNQGLDDIFLPAGAKDEDRPAFFESVTITGTGSGNSFNTSKLTGTDDSTTADPDKGVDVVIGNITIDESYGEIKGDFSNVGVVGSENGGDGNLHITLPENGNVAITGPFSNGPKVVDENGDIIPGDDNLGGLFFESEGIVPSTSTGSIAIGDGAFEKDETTGKSPAFPNNSVKDPFSNNEYASPTDTIPADEVVISNVTSIGKDAFKGNENVERITIPADCTSIGVDAFAGCTNLKEIIFEGPRTESLEIAEGAFAGCTSLNKISTVEKNGDSYTYTEGKEGVFDFTMMENMVGSIGANAFGTTTEYESGANPSNVKLPSTLTEISNDSFVSGTKFEYTVSVGDFKEWNGTTGTAENVTFTGKFGEDGGISANAPKDVNTNGNGYKPSWSIGSNNATISGGTASFGSLSVSDLVSNKGGEVSWNISSGKVTIDGEEVTVEVGKSWNDYSKYFDSSTGGRYAIGTESNVAENELIDLDSDITGDDIGETISKYYEVTVVGTGTKELIKVDSDIASTVTGKPGKYFASTNGSLSGQITLSDSLQKVGEAPVYIYEYVTLTFDAYDTSYGKIGGNKIASYDYIKGSKGITSATVTANKN